MLSEAQALDAIVRELHQQNELIKLMLTIKLKEQEAEFNGVKLRLDSKFQDKINEVLK